MALHKIRLGTNEDGTPHYFYQQDDPSIPLVITGPITGSVATSDGTTYDVSDPVIEVQPGHELEVSDLIGQRHADEGHPLHDADKPFVHTPSGLSHDKDGNPSPKYREALESLIPANEVYEGPQTVIDKLTKKKG
jgi:hypothetical protein